MWLRTVLWICAPLGLVRKLRLVQDVSQPLLWLGLSSVNTSRQCWGNYTGCYYATEPSFKVLLLPYKALNNVGLGYLRNDLNVYIPSCPLPSSTRGHPCGAACPRGSFHGSLDKVLQLSYGTECLLKLDSNTVCILSDAKTFLFSIFTGFLRRMSLLAGSICFLFLLLYTTLVLYWWYCDV